MNGRWQAVAAHLLSWRELDGQWLVHDAGCGQLHLLDPATAAVLSALEEAPGSVSDVARALQVQSGQAPAMDAVASAFTNLAGASLIMPAAQ